MVVWLRSFSILLYIHLSYSFLTYPITVNSESSLSFHILLLSTQPYSARLSTTMLVPSLDTKGKKLASNFCHDHSTENIQSHIDWLCIFRHLTVEKCGRKINCPYSSVLLSCQSGDGKYTARGSCRASTISVNVSVWQVPPCN